VKTLRGRLFAYLGLAVAVSSVLTVLVAGILSRRYVERQALRNLERQALVAAAVLDAGSAEAARRLTLFFRAQGDLLLTPETEPGRGAGLRSVLLATGDRAGSAEFLGRKVLFAVADSSLGPVVLARPSQGGSDWRPYVVILVLAGAGGAVVAAGLSYFLARRLSRPLRQMSDASRRLAAGEPEVRVPVEGDDELGALSASCNEMAGQLATAREAERTFLMSVSHELKTPLTAVRGYAEALRDGAAAPQEAGEVIGREADRLERLVRDLLDLARLDRRQFSVGREPVDLSDVAHEVRSRYAPRAEEFRVELSVEADAPARAMGDRDRLVQVLSNLVENALRSTPAGGRVAVRAADGLLEVQDTGPGLLPEDIPHAFDRFFLYRKYGADRPLGSGLGLAIVRELVQAMAGTVSVRSEPGAGASFEVRLPAAS